MLLDSHPADDTRALIIDFDQAEIKDKTNNDDKREDEGKNRKKCEAVVRLCICLYWAWLMTH